MVKIIAKPPTGKAVAPLHNLKSEQSEFLKEGITTNKKPASPINVVNSNHLGMYRIARANFRNLFLLPWLIGVCLTLYWQIDDFYEGWKLYEASIIDMIEYRKKKYGDDYYDKLRSYINKESPNHIGEKNTWFTIEKSALDSFDEVENGQIPFKTYFHYHYYEVAYPERNRRTDTVLAIMYLISIPTLLISYLSFRRQAPLYFDRERGIVYTWIKGQVWAQYYDDLFYSKNKHVLAFALYGFHPEEEFVYNGILIAPSGNLYFNDEMSYRALLASITHFMVNGRDAVIKKDWKGRQGFYLFKDKKPDDFDEQLESVLKYIKDNKINEQAEKLSKEWGYLPADEAPAS